MRQFHVPQFIEVEDKIFGPLTLKQFLYIIGGGGIVFLIYTFLSPFLPLFIILVIAAPVGAFFAALAFYKVNGQPFIKILENPLTHYTNSRLFIWKKIERPAEVTKSEARSVKHEGAPFPNPSRSKLTALSWSLDVHHGRALPNTK